MRGFLNYAEGRTKKDDIEQEGKQTKRLSKAKKGLIALGVVGVGGCIYGFIKGQKIGYHRGVMEGIVYANTQFTEAAKTYVESLQESKGE